MSIREKEQQTDEFGLSVYLMTLRSLHSNINSYEEEAHLMYEEFGIQVSENDLYNLENPPIPEENKYSLLYKTLGL